MERAAAPVAPRPVWLLVGAAGVLTSAAVHYWLYVEGGYRGIAPDEVLGLTISRSFVLNAAGGLLVAWALVVAVRMPRLALPAVLAGVGFAAATLVAYLLSRTVGLLGFEESTTTTEAVLAFVAEITALVALGGWLAAHMKENRHELRTH